MPSAPVYSPTTEAQYLKGVGPRLGAALAKLGIGTISDLVYSLPRRYEDRSNFIPIRSLKPGDWATIRGKVIDIVSQKSRGPLIIRAAISDGSASIHLVWFNQQWIRAKLTRGKTELIAYGLVKSGDYGYQIQSPEWEFIDSQDDPDQFARITPVYSLREGVSQNIVRKAVRSALAQVGIFEDALPEHVRSAHELMPLAEALRQIHFPDSMDSVAAARRRLVFEEFLGLQLAQCLRHREVGLLPGHSFDVSWKSVEAIEAAAGFSLTSAQRRVIGEIFADMAAPHPMNRLLQGDVGSGKTAVAAVAMLAAVRSGWQAALMAPTEILAEQHAASLRRIFDPLGVQVQLLVSKQKAKAKKSAVERISSGDAQISVGTHALIQDAVSFDKLGLVVIDEQHRFGVMQRAAIRSKGVTPDVLVMSATPIPRTLTLTLYGDLDLSVIDEMPPGRQQIATHWKKPNERHVVYEGVRKLLLDGAQVYVVCPLVAESEKMQMQAAEELYDRMRSEVFPEFSVGLVHGQLKGQDKEEAMGKFRSGETRILVATSVIEVGVDVPAASVMVIEDANRFGLAQLHQLRGRVGRGERKSYCVLIGAAQTPDAEERLRVMVETTDGFRISEEDLRIRGPGDLFGTRQSGSFELRIADLLRDGRVLEEAHQAALQILDDDPDLAKKENLPLRRMAETATTRILQTDAS